jgi:hypothetical protein
MVDAVALLMQPKNTADVLKNIHDAVSDITDEVMNYLANYERDDERITNGYE